MGWFSGATCCRRLRGSGNWNIPFHGLTPTAKCGRRIRGLLEPPGLDPGDYHYNNPIPQQCCGLGGSGVAAVEAGQPRKRLLQVFLILRSRPPDTPHRISLRLAARLLRLPLKGGVIALGARASRPHPVPLAAAELQCDAAGSHPVGGNPIGQAEGEPWRRSRLIQVGEMAEAVPGLVRAGRPRSREAIIVRAGRPRSQEAIIP